MLSVQRIKELLEAPEMPDQEAEHIRDALTAFVRKALDLFVYQNNNPTYESRKIERNENDTRADSPVLSRPNFRPRGNGAFMVGCKSKRNSA